MVSAWTIARNWAGNFSRLAGDFLHPPQCVWCGQATQQSQLCVECVMSLAPAIPWRCVRCSAPVGPYMQSEEGCHRCAAERYVFQRVVSLGAYDGELGRACRSCKQPMQQPLTMALARVLAERERETLLNWNLDAIVPVPHHWSQRWRAGHHAADTVAETIGAACRIPVERHLLSKVRRTPKQTSLSGRERRNNLKQAFRIVGRPKLTGLRFLIADDILTTGATAQRVAAELLRGGAAAVYIAVLGRSLKVPPATDER